ASSPARVFLSAPSSPLARRAHFLSPGPPGPGKVHANSLCPEGTFLSLAPNTKCPHPEAPIKNGRDPRGHHESFFLTLYFQNTKPRGVKRALFPNLYFHYSHRVTKKIAFFAS